MKNVMKKNKDTTIKIEDYLNNPFEQYFCSTPVTSHDTRRGNRMTILIEMLKTRTTYIIEITINTRSVITYTEATPNSQPHQGQTKNGKKGVYMVLMNKILYCIRVRSVNWNNFQWEKFLSFRTLF